MNELLSSDEVSVMERRQRDLDSSNIFLFLKSASNHNTRIKKKSHLGKTRQMTEFNKSLEHLK